MTLAILKKRKKDNYENKRMWGRKPEAVEDIPKPSVYAKASACSASLTPIFSFP